MLDASWNLKLKSLELKIKVEIIILRNGFQIFKYYVIPVLRWIKFLALFHSFNFKLNLKHKRASYFKKQYTESPKLMHRSFISKYYQFELILPNFNILNQQILCKSPKKYKNKLQKCHSRESRENHKTKTFVCNSWQ